MASVISRTLEHEYITEAESRGNSRPVSREEFQRLANAGAAMLAERQHNSAPLTGLDAHWSTVKTLAYAQAQTPWGGVTIDAHTGQLLDGKADAYAITVKPAGMHTVAVPENAGPERFGQAMDLAKQTFRPVLEREGYYLGVFHDNDTGLIDIDPVLVVATLAEVEAIGAYTHAIGGAYHFASGEGFFPPHVAEPVPALAA